MNALTARASSVTCVVVAGGVVSYDIPEGSEPDHGLTDSSYDGRRTEDGRLVGGLGRLTDGEYGADNFRLDTAYGKGMLCLKSSLNMLHIIRIIYR